MLQVAVAVLLALVVTAYGAAVDRESLLTAAVSVALLVLLSVGYAPLRSVYAIGAAAIFAFILPAIIGDRTWPVWMRPLAVVTAVATVTLPLANMPSLG
jgi:hypothetical protein